MDDQQYDRQREALAQQWQAARTLEDLQETLHALLRAFQEHLAHAARKPPAMIHAPTRPYWAWNMHHGEHGAFFSRPPSVGDHEALWPFTEPGALTAGPPLVSGGGACLARCATHEYAIPNPLDDDVRTWPVQCGAVAAIAPDGDMVCLEHIHMMWQCDECGVWLEAPGGCCAACHQAFAAQPPLTEEEQAERAAAAEEIFADLKEQRYAEHHQLDDDLANESLKDKQAGDEDHPWDEGPPDDEEPA